MKDGSRERPLLSTNPPNCQQRQTSNQTWEEDFVSPTSKFPETTILLRKNILKEKKSNLSLWS